jgi:hypothetical protein
VEAAASVPSAAQIDPKSTGLGITFAVDPVTEAENPIWGEALRDSLSRRLKRKIFVLPEEQKQVINAERDSFEHRGRAIDEKQRADLISRLGSRCHPFIDAVHIAFAQHRPLTLSPDAIWLLIAQGFSHHVAENAESLRSRLVRHEGKRELTVQAFDLTLASFEEAISGFSSLIRQEIDPVLHETLICDFSTTRRAIRTASEVVLMDSFSSYFEYAMICVCGIPKITVEGTLADWQRIRARVEVIETYGLEWWVSRLRPILDEFVLAAEGRPTQDFWQAIYKPKDAYADKVATGWVADLFPYLGDAPKRRRNHVFDHERHNWALSVDQGVKTAHSFGDPLVWRGVRLKSFPSGLSSARVKVLFRDSSSQDLDLVAGFLAVTQNPSDLALSPFISWCAAEPEPEEPVMIPERPTRSDTSFTSLLNSLRNGEIEGASSHDSKTSIVPNEV